jgi:sugar phosphate isomerase/epimerase
MKLSCIPVSYYPQILGGEMSIRDWAYHGKELGLDGIDLSILFIQERSPSYLDALRKDIEDTGIGVVMITTYPDFTHPDPAQREHEITQSREDIRVAGHLGAELVRLTAGQAHPTTGREEGIAWALDGIQRVLEIGEKHKVRLVFENHSKPGVWQYADFSHPTDIFLEIAERLADSIVGIHWDTANTLVYGDDPLPVLEKVIDRVVCVHAADTAVRGELRPVQIGTGIVPFRKMFHMLKERGFDGWICIEEASSQGRPGFEAAVRFVRETWQEA